MEYWMVNTWLEKGETYLTSWHLPRHMQIYRCPWDSKNVPHLHFLTSFTVQCPSVPCLSGIYAQIEIRGALYDFCNMYCTTIGNWICDSVMSTWNLFFSALQVKKCCSGHSFSRELEQNRIKTFVLWAWLLPRKSSPSRYLSHT